jgi:hypothetical protein
MNINISKPEQKLVNKLRKFLPVGQQLKIESFLYDIHYGRKIIEFNGDYWHANPELYLFEDFVGNIIDNKPTYAYEIWAKDEKKKRVAEEHGYEVMVVWESDFTMMPRTTVEKCLNFLKG